MTLDPIAVHAAIYRVLTTTPAVPVWRGSTLLTVDPLTVEEARVLAPVLTAAVLSTITEGATAA